MAKKQKENPKLKALTASIEKLTKTYGKGAVMKLGGSAIEGVETISTGSIALDMALGVGGFAKRRVVEIYGAPSCGKTTLAIHAIAECQKMGGIAAFVDVEHAFDKQYAENLGVNTDELIFSQPDYGEAALEIAEGLIRSNAIDLLIVDSVAALVPKAEIEGEMGKSSVGLQARLMSQAMRKLTSAINKANCCVIFINQTRDKIGVLYGSPETTTGGNALKFYASQRLRISKKSAPVKDRDGNATASHVTVKVLKNKLAPPFQVAEFDIEYGKGISKVGEIVDMGVEYGVLTKSGSWYGYGDGKIAQGREAAKKFLLDNPEVADEVEQKIRNTIAGIS